MKIILKPLLLILKIVAVILVICLIFFGLMYKSVTPPPYDPTNGFNSNQLLTEKADELISEENVDKQISIELSNESTNNELKTLLLKQFVPEAGDDYIIEEGNVKVQGVWIDYKTNLVEISVGAHFDAKLLTFKTRVLLSFEITHETNQIYLKLKSVKIGNLGVTWLLKIAPSLINKIVGLDVEDLINDVVKDIGTFDSSKLQVNIDVEKLIDKANINDPLINSVIDLLIEEEFFTLKLVEDNVSFNFDFKKLENLEVIESLAGNKRITSEAELKQFLALKMFKSIVLNSSKPEVKFNQEEFLKILDYLVLGKHNKNVIHEQILLEQYNLVIGAPFMEFKDSVATLMLPVTFGKGIDSFKTVIKLETNFTKNNNDLVVSFTTGIIGELDLNEELLEQLLITANLQTIVVKDLFADLTIGGSDVESIAVINDKLVIKWYAENNQEDVLRAFENDPSLPQDFKDIVSEILNNLTNQLPYEENVDELVDYLINVADEQLLDDIMDIINNTFLN